MESWINQTLISDIDVWYFVRALFHLQPWRSSWRWNKVQAKYHTSKSELSVWFIQFSTYLFIFYAFDSSTSPKFWLLACHLCLTHSYSLRHFATLDTQPKMGASKNSFIVQIKLVYLPHFNILNFTWTSKSSHHSDTHVYQGRRLIFRSCVLFSFLTHPHPHTLTDTYTNT